MRTHWDKRSKTLLIFAAILFCLFILLTIAVNLYPINRIDIAISRTLQSTSWAFVFEYTDRFFNEITIRVFCVIIIAYALNCKKYAIAGLFAVSAVIEVVSIGIKSIFHRPRPSAGLVLWHGSSTGFSYISSHTFEYSFFFWISAFLVYYSLPGEQHKAVRRISVALLVILSLIIGANRIYTGNHWFTDVLGSYLFAGCIVLVTVMLMPKTFSPRSLNPADREHSSQ
jgi:membrane-associated phospholipid phosphatase